MRHPLSVEKRGGHRSLYGKIDILGNIAGSRSNRERVQFCNDDAGDGPVPVEKRAAAVPRLDRCGDLQEPAIVPKPGKRGDVASGDVAPGG